MTRLALLLALLLLAPAAKACGPDTDCTLGERTYRIYLPQTPDSSPMGALIFAHGYKGTAGAVMRNSGLRALADRLGIALVAPNADGDDWRLPGAPAGLSNTPDTALAYFDALRADLLTRHRLDPARLIVSGFSAGGMMTWTLACHRPADYAGFIPLSGTFWRPAPDRCTLPAADIIHIHGTSDTVVPLAGRPIGPAFQGDVDSVLAMYRRTGGHQPVPAPNLTPDLTCEAWSASNSATLLKCLHPGGHRYDPEYIETAWPLILPR